MIVKEIAKNYSGSQQFRAFPLSRAIEEERLAVNLHLFPPHQNYSVLLVQQPCLSTSLQPPHSPVHMDTESPSIPPFTRYACVER